MIEMKGIYKYTDLKTGVVVYIGKDSYIDENRRHIHHLRPSTYDHQQINRVLQNNPDRYEYGVICAFDDLSDDELNYLEIKEIMKHKFLYDKKPKFNFTIGGDGSTGYKRIKNNPFYGVNCTGENNPFYNKHHSEESMVEMSKYRNTSGYFRVSKQKKKGIKQGFLWTYSYYDVDGKRKFITSVSFDKLEIKVKNKGLLWRKL